MSKKVKTPQEVIFELAKSLTQMETDSKFIQNLGNSKASKYEECWREYYKREYYKKYHDPIIQYILKKAHWQQNEKGKAEDILQLVNIKAFSWSFKRLKKGMFRIVISSFGELK